MPFTVFNQNFPTSVGGVQAEQPANVQRIPPLVESIPSVRREPVIVDVPQQPQIAQVQPAALQPQSVQQPLSPFQSALRSIVIANRQEPGSVPREKVVPQPQVAVAPPRGRDLGEARKLGASAHVQSALTAVLPKAENKGTCNKSTVIITNLMKMS